MKRSLILLCTAPILLVGCDTTSPTREPTASAPTAPTVIRSLPPAPKVTPCTGATSLHFAPNIEEVYAVTHNLLLVRDIPRWCGSVLYVFVQSTTTIRPVPVDASRSTCVSLTSDQDNRAEYRIVCTEGGKSITPFLAQRHPNVLRVQKVRP